MFHKTTAVIGLTLGASLIASADFSYTDTQKATGGSMAAMAGTAADRTSKYYFKGQKMMTSSGDSVTVVDFGAQTVTFINNALKTYSVKKLSDLTAAAGNTDVTVDVKDTGQKKKVNGFDATEAIVSLDMDMDMGSAGRGMPAMKLTVEMDLWISPDVPGSGDMRAFYQKNAANFPWGAVSGAGGNQALQKAMGQMMQALAKINGVVVERVIRVKQAGAPAPVVAQMPQMTPAQQAQMQAAMSKMTPAQQAQMQGMMGAMGRGAAAGGTSSGSAALIELTADASAFSDASVPDSVFAIPAGYKQNP